MITGEEPFTALIKNNGIIAEGLTIRQYFAGLNMAAMLSQPIEFSVDKQ